MQTPINACAVRLLDGAGALTDPITVPKVLKSDDAWRLQLTDEQFRVTRTAGTERAFCGVFHDNHKSGLYTCAACGLPLFRSHAKFESGTGWPSFFQPVAEENIGITRDATHGMVRTEVHCVRCDSHLGHVFEDGPAPTNLRYCINSAALLFREEGVKAAREKVIFGAGCFWGVETTFEAVEGVTATRVGYSGGMTENPTYEDVCSHGTGHAEVVEVEYDPAQLGIDQLLEVFWKSHNPATRDRQDPDTGSQYRSAIFFHHARPGSCGARLRRKARCKRHAPRADHHPDRVRRAVPRGGGASPEISCEARRIMSGAYAMMPFGKFRVPVSKRLTPFGKLRVPPAVRQMPSGKPGVPLSTRKMPFGISGTPPGVWKMPFRESGTRSAVQNPDPAISPPLSAMRPSMGTARAAAC